MHLKRFPKIRLIFDPEDQDVHQHELFNSNSGADWKEFYGDIKEERPPGCPGSHSGILVIIQKTCVIRSRLARGICHMRIGIDCILRIARDLLVALRLSL